MHPGRIPVPARRALIVLASLCLMLCGEPMSTPAYADPAPATAAGVDAATVFKDSTSVPCASGTTDLGVHDGYHLGVKIPVRLCRVDNLPGTRSESVPSSPYYIGNANRHAIVNSRVSGDVQTMIRDMKAAGISPTAFSSYRSMQHQRDLCVLDTDCTAHRYHYLAEPGTSNHQMGLAVDFTMPLLKTPGASCTAPARVASNTVWKWLQANAGRYGLKQYMAEPWHWEAAGANSC